MKLKERPLEWWKGKKFTYWCRADVNDERKINYTMNHRSIGQGLQVFRFTSEEEVDWLMMQRIRESVIEEIKLENDEWHVVIAAGIIPAELLRKKR